MKKKTANGKHLNKQINRDKHRIFQKYQVMLGEFTNFCESKFNNEHDTHLP